jgi:7-carboxy-7-deazaguanine synthase
MDIKCPGSQMHEKNRWENLNHLKPTDEIKMVLADRADFEWAMIKIKEHRLTERFKVLLSPAFGLLKPKDLAEWIVAEKLDVRLNLQQHKYIWHPRAKGV